MIEIFYLVGQESSTIESLQFNLATIEAATNNFSHENKIGKGGFGEVYKVRTCDNLFILWLCFSILIIIYILREFFLMDDV